MTELDDVRACVKLLNSTIVCSGEAMYTMLVNKKIARVWWQLADNERSVLAEYIITHYLFNRFTLWGIGGSDCVGGVTEWKTAYCMQNAMIRFMLLGEADEHKLTSCYYKLIAGDTERCFWSGNCFGLPVYIVTILSTAGLDFGHAVCALQIKGDVDNFDSWRYFQYANSHIIPGIDQMPCGAGRTIYVQINDVFSIDCTGYSYDIKAKWIFTDNCIPVSANIAPIPSSSECYKGVIIYKSTCPTDSSYSIWTQEVGGGGVSCYSSLISCKSYIDSLYYIGHGYNQCLAPTPTPSPTPIPKVSVTINSVPSGSSVEIDGGYVGAGSVKVLKGNLIESILKGAKQSNSVKSHGCGCKSGAKK